MNLLYESGIPTIEPRRDHLHPNFSNTLFALSIQQYTNISKQKSEHFNNTPCLFRFYF